MAEQGTARERGTIKVYYSLREYGFISRKKGKDIFFTRSAFQSEDQIAEGAIVEFSVLQTPKGPRAEDAVRIG